MITFILFVIVFVIWYVLGAKNGIPSFGKKKEDLTERIDFLSMVRKGDKLRIYEYSDKNSFLSDYKITYKVVRNDPTLNAVEFKQYDIIGDPFTLYYEDNRFRSVIDDNIMLVSELIEINEKNKN